MHTHKLLIIFLLSLLINTKAQGNCFHNNNSNSNSKYICITQVRGNADRVFEYALFHDSITMQTFDFSKSASRLSAIKIVMNKKQFYHFFNVVSSLKCCTTERYRNTLYLTINGLNSDNSKSVIKIDEDSPEGKTILDLIPI